jgi:hypothetical protein
LDVDNDKLIEFLIYSKASLLMSIHTTGTPKEAIQAAFLPYPHGTSIIGPFEFKAISSAYFAKIFDGEESIGFLWIILVFLIKIVPHGFIVMERSLELRGNIKKMGLC